MYKNTNIFIKDITERKTCFGSYYELKGSIYAKPYAITFKNYEKHNLESCKSCSDNYKIIKENTEAFLKKFPHCCEYHSKLLSDIRFNKDDFKDLPEWVADKSLNTNFHIIENISKENWYEEITNFIHYVIFSFGQFPDDKGEPACLSHYINYVTRLQLSSSLDKDEKQFQSRKDAILKFLSDIKKPSTDKKTDFNLLISIYEKWYKIFPFEIEFFSNLKNYFGKTLPILAEEPIPNPYTGTVKAKMQTPDQLLNRLLEITKLIISKIDTTQLLDNEYITSEEKYLTDLKKKHHQLNQNILHTKFLKGELSYIKTLKKWLENEKLFISDIKPFAKNIPKEIAIDIEYTFETLFEEKKQLYYLELLEELSITKDGKSILSERKKSALRGVNEVLRENCFLPNLSLEHLNKITAKKIGLELKSKLDHSTTCRNFIKSTNNYLKTHPFIK